MPSKLTKDMATPKTTTLRLKMRNTGEEVDAEIKLLSATQMALALRKIGIKTVDELFRLKELNDLRIIEVLENLSAEALSVSERWAVNDVRNAFDVEALALIVTALGQGLAQVRTGKRFPYGYHQ